MENPNIQPRYMNSTKKHYYLASVNENVQQLVKQEIDGLTTVLIDLKSQYDIISKESIEKKLQTDELTKKIDSIQKIVKHSRSQIEDTNAKSKNLANLIKQKRTQLNEGLYQMKTLLGNINKLKKDNFLLQKKINVNENITKRLANNNQTEILKETVLKGKKNKVHSEIANQNAKNIFNEGEQKLQLQYYKTIIEQKNMFIRTDEERKERQKKLAEEAKNNSADKQEIEKRKILCLLKLYNIYLENEMAKSLKENEEIETTYRSIREIVGSPSLKVIVDKILTKETTYNDSLAQINELENLIEVYNKDIEQLESKLKLLKNEQIVQQNDEKTLSTIQSNLIQEDESQLLKEEEELIAEEKLLKDKLLQVNLTYKKIMENIEFFIEEMKGNPDLIKDEKKEKVIKKNYNFDDTNDNFFQQKTMPGQSTVYDPNSTKNEMNNTKTTDNKQNNISPLMTTTKNYFSKDESKNNNLTQNKFFSRGSTPKNKILDEIRIPTDKKELKKDDSMKPISQKEQYNENNIISGLNDENEKEQEQQQEESLFDNMNNSNEIVKNYNDFLIWLNKKFDKFFLCFNKEQFKVAMAEKGYKGAEQSIEQKNKNTGADRNTERKVTKKRRNTKRFERINTLNKMHIDESGKNMNKLKTEDNEVEVDEDEIVVKQKDDGNKLFRVRKKDNKPSNDIFQRFLEEQESKLNEYIHEKELRNKKVVKTQS